ncbi:hypothetical protein OHA84_19135 [Streptomyces sp. NBC_00513]|uniref:hypothetical protein n=1 Tax=unclassified Streptomyces TaxID=2593676 RepID=UPI0022586DD6|nr:hypothetical protein [Streptomyces sp. NBC_00424]MCX5074358.1 hypothetical protein [Streptomyces sp. NBC_00424]WUD42451.1 hypothetical protein OHA84_19135 [Streptomyces sp. NBC_00513]
MRTGSRAALALTLCCSTAAAALTGCGGATRDGYVAVGAAAPGPERGAGENVPPRGQVELQRLGAPPTSGTASASTGTPAGSPAPQTSGDGGNGPTPPPGGGSVPAPNTGTGAEPGLPGAPAGTTGGTGGSSTGGAGGSVSTGGSGSTGGAGSGGSGTPRPPTSPPGTTPTPTPAPATPARLTLGAPTRSGAADRWCENVTVSFTNTGTTAARSGTITFATHIIGALGVDWATRTTTQPLPTPIAGGTTKTRTYTVCVESWRVPLGMHVDTRNVTATWN